MKIKNKYVFGILYYVKFFMMIVILQTDVNQNNVVYNKNNFIYLRNLLTH